MEVVARLRHRLGRTRRSLRGRARGRQRKKENRQHEGGRGKKGLGCMGGPRHTATTQGF